MSIQNHFYRHYHFFYKYEINRNVVDPGNRFKKKTNPIRETINNWSNFCVSLLTFWCKLFIYDWILWNTLSKMSYSFYHLINQILNIYHLQINVIWYKYPNNKLHVQRYYLSIYDHRTQGVWFGTASPFLFKWVVCSFSLDIISHWAITWRTISYLFVLYWIEILYLPVIWNA